jgi:hypothetical protein
MKRIGLAVAYFLCCAVPVCTNGDDMVNPGGAIVSMASEMNTSENDLTAYGQDAWDGANKSKACCPCDCRRPIVPSMIGDGGLVIPHIHPYFYGAAFWQNHIYKVAENNSVLPQNRIGFNFNYMSDVSNGALAPATAVKDDIFEYRLFAEKTLFNGKLSVDFMVPFYQSSLINFSSAELGGNPPGTEASFGDLAFGGKYLVWDNERSALSAGLRVEAPTNEEFRFTADIPFGDYALSDDVWNFTPYLAMLLTPSERVFVQSFVSYRMGSQSLVESFTTNNFRQTIRDQDYFMADLSAGYWLYRDSCGRGLTGLVPTVELHYTATFEDQKATASQTFPNIYYSNTDVLNLTAGLTALFGDRMSLTAGVAVPLRDTALSQPPLLAGLSTDRRYDWALMVNMNYYFGR